MRAGISDNLHGDGILDVETHGGPRDCSSSGQTTAGQQPRIATLALTRWPATRGMSPIEPRQYEHASQERHEPNDARLVAILDVGQDTRDGGVSNHHEHDDGGEPDHAR